MDADTMASEGARRVAAAAGVCVGISGLDHGFFEILQGNAPISGVVIQAIGPEQQMWESGTEEAFTIVPNFLITGILAMLLGVAMIVWSVGFLDEPRAHRGYLALGLLMFLVGGGIGMLVFLLLGWAVARRIHRPAAWWGRVLPGALESTLARTWRGAIGVAGLLYGVALEIAIVGYVPGVTDPALALSICWGSLLATLVVFVLALFGASSHPRIAAPLEVWR
jgi:hypothetical protein